MVAATCTRCGGPGRLALGAASGVLGLVGSTWMRCLRCALPGRGLGLETASGVPCPVGAWLGGCIRSQLLGGDLDAEGHPVSHAGRCMARMWKFRLPVPSEGHPVKPRLRTWLGCRGSVLWCPRGASAALPGWAWPGCGVRQLSGALPPRPVGRGGSSSVSSSPRLVPARCARSIIIGYIISKAARAGWEGGVDGDDFGHRRGG